MTRAIDTSQRTAAQVAGWRGLLTFTIVVLGNYALLLGFKRVLKPKGICVLIGGGPDEGRWIGPMARPIKAMLLSPFVSQKFTMLLANMNKSDLTVLAELMQNGKVTPVIDRRYSFDQIQEAIRYLEKGHARGKVVIAID